MFRAKLIVFTFMGILGFGFIIAIPISVLSVNFYSHDTINESLFYEYLPNDPPQVESLFLNIDYGNIEINYVDPPVDYLVRVDVNIEMGGAGLNNKDYSDFFTIIEGALTSSPINFTMKLLPEISVAEVKSLVKDVSIVISIQKSDLLDISANVFYGNVSIEVPFKVKTNSLHFNLTTGNIFYDLNRCIVGGNISGIVDNGRIVLISENVEYIQNSVWTLYSNKNSISIIQHNRMGANVTGSITTVADIGTPFFYNDTSSEVGAKFSLFDYDYVNFPNGTRVNFDYDILGSKECSYTSTDFPANNNYEFSFYLGGKLYYDLFNT